MAKPTGDDVKIGAMQTLVIVGGGALLTKATAGIGFINTALANLPADFWGVSPKALVMGFVAFLLAKTFMK